MSDFLATISKASGEKSTLRQRICAAVIEGIKSGSLPPGAALPPTRELSRLLRVSRDTVARSYAELHSLNYIESSSTRGTFVKEFPSEKPDRDSKVIETDLGDTALSSYGRRLAEYNKALPFSPDFKVLNFGGPPSDMLPFKRWQANVQKFAKACRVLNYQPQPLGQMQLRLALQSFLLRSKGIKTTAANIAVFSSTLTALNLLFRVLVEPGELVAVEEPGFAGARDAAYGLGASILTVPVDEHGMQVEYLLERNDVRLVYITPCHDPTGAILSLERRKQLINWASEHNAWIVEDDFHGHFYYGKNAEPSLKRLDESDCVIYLSSFWKLLFPLTNIGFCVLPKRLVSVIETTKVQGDGLSDVITQLSLAELIECGYLERHIRRVKRAYSERRHLLIHHLTLAFGKDIRITGTNGSNHIIISFRSFTEQQVFKSAKEAGLPLLSMSSYYADEPKNPEWITDFSCLGEDVIKTVISRMLEILQPSKKMVPKNLDH